MSTNSTLVEFPTDLLVELDEILGTGKAQALLVEMAKRQIKLHRQAQALKEVAGSWNAEDHPELSDGAYPYIRSIREDRSRDNRIEEHRKSS